jgi:hypothetical protein
VLFIGNFVFTTNQEKQTEAERRHGEFSLFIEAQKSDDAFNYFKQRIVELKKTRDFFEGHSSIYFVQLLEFDSLPQTKAMMLNYKSYAGDPIMPFIGCVVPSDDTDGCRIYNWENKKLGIDGKQAQLFLEFKA